MAEYEDEDQIVARLRAGDAAAFERLVRENGPRLLATARRILKQEEDARDAVQESFLSAHRAIGNFHGDSALSTWLHRIVINRALMKLRSQKARPEEPIETLLPTFAPDGHHAEFPQPWPLSAHALLEQRELRAFVRAAIDRLPETHRTVLLLRDIEELSTDEAAAVLQCTPGALKVRLHRAHQALRTLIDRQLKVSAP